MKAVLFDLDDTLYPERSFVESGFRAVAAHLARTTHLEPEDLVQCMMDILNRDGRGRVFDTVLRDLGQYHREVVRTLVQVYRTHRPDIHLFPDVPPGLQRLRDGRTLLGIVTDGLASVQRSKIDALGLEEMVDTVVCSDDVGLGEAKPSTAPFLVALERLQVEPPEATYVGDDPAKDFQGPRELGMKTIHMYRRALVSRLARPGIDRADQRVETFEELLAVLEAVRA